MSHYFSRFFPKKSERLDEEKPHEWGRKMSVLEKGNPVKVKEKVKERNFCLLREIEV